MKIFMDTTQAAQFHGMTRRGFERKYLDTGQIQPLRFKPGSNEQGRGDGKHFFLRKEVEKLKR